MSTRLAIFAAFSAVLLTAIGAPAAHHEEQQYLEFRTYHLSSADEMAQVTGS